MLSLSCLWKKDAVFLESCLPSALSQLSLKLYMHRNHRLGSTSDVHANVISSASNSQTKLNLITYGIPLLI
jgi:hypothetical protein